HRAGTVGVPTVAPGNTRGRSIARAILTDSADFIRRAPESHSAMISSLLEIEESNVAQADVPSNEAGDEHINVEAHRTGKRRIDVIVKIARGFHIYDSDVDPRHGLTATRLYVRTDSSDPPASIEYPPAKLLELPYGPAVAGYMGRVEIVVRFAADLRERPINLSLSYQVCDDTACLRPSVARVAV
ncbi:MAG TPA: protein-disulfide reductase DsbD family protein, partial [Tepidisphaeraceae bacterium]|nr:protein-disulfide reductase DsbD family protein [Tepidisphaeraceae bacterium]